MEQPTNRKAIWVFTPSRTDPKDLEFILVQREELLQDAVERVRESALTNHKHHLLFVGPRGCGKTHLVSLIVSRLGEDDELTDRLRIAWLNEDETCTTLLELLLKVHAALEKRYPNEYREERLAGVYDLKQDAAQEFVSQQLLSTLGSRTLLVMTENLDAIFEGLGDLGQKQLRSFIQENPKLSIVATAQRLLEDFSRRTSPFFGFFQTEHLKPLNVEEATELLQNIARLHGKSDVVEFLSTSRGHSRVRALHHLSGGNHRIYIVLSQFITRDSIDALLGPFMKMVDELTPYYQERIRWLPPLQRKIVEYLCSRESTVPVKEIAKRLFATSQTISSQLQDLRHKGYIEANQRGRESLYEISEPLMRICVEVKENQGQQPLRLLVDFLRVWYDEKQLTHHLEKIELASISRVYLESAIQINSVEGNIRKLLFLEDLDLSLPEKMNPVMRAYLLRECAILPEAITLAVESWHAGDSVEAKRCLDEAIAEEANLSNRGELLLSRGQLYSALGDSEKAIEDYTAVIRFSGAPVGDVAKALFNRAVTYGEIGDTQREIDDYTKVVELSNVPIENLAKALFNRGSTYNNLGNVQRAIEDYSTVIGLFDAPVEEVAKALINRGFANNRVGMLQRAIEDYTTVMGLSDASVENVARALLNRGITYTKMDETHCAIEDFTAVSELSGAPVEEIARALFNRGIAHGKLGEPSHEIEDYTAVMELSDVPVENVAKALFNRGVTYGQVGELQREIEDYTAVIKLFGAPVEIVATSLFNRGVAYGHSGDPQHEIEDYTAVIGLSGAPVEQVAKALFSRGVTYGEVGDPQHAIKDFSTVIGLSGAPVEQVAKALFNRALIYYEIGELQRAIQGYTAVIGFSGASTEHIARALFNRGLTHAQIGETQRAIEDYTDVIGLSGAPIERVAMSFYMRGVTFFEKSRQKESRADFETLTQLANAPVEKVIDAYMALCEIHWSEGQWTKGFKALENGLQSGLKAQPPYHGPATNLIGMIFSAGLNPLSRITTVSKLLDVYAKHQALPVLGEALIRHSSNIFRAGKPWPSTDNLEQWAFSWEQAAEIVTEFRLSVRLLRTSINFIKTSGKDPSILLDLTSAERAILQQALGLNEKK